MSGVSSIAVAGLLFGVLAGVAAAFPAGGSVVLAARPPAGEPGAAAGWAITAVASVAAAGVLLWAFRWGPLKGGAMRTPSRDAEGLPWAGWAAVGLGAFLAQSFAASSAALAIPSDASALQRQTLTGLIGYASAAVVLGAVVVGARRAAVKAGFRARPADLWLGSLGFLLTMPLVWVVLALGRWAQGTLADPADPLAHETLRMLDEAPRDAWWWGMIAVVVIGAPLVEEAIFRGSIQTAAVAAGMRPLGAVVLTSLLFVSIHLGALEPGALAGLFVLSMGFGIVFERTGRLGASVVMHAIFNGANLLLAFA